MPSVLFGLFVLMVWFVDSDVDAVVVVEVDVFVLVDDLFTVLSVIEAEVEVFGLIAILRIMEAEVEVDVWLVDGPVVIGLRLVG